MRRMRIIDSKAARGIRLAAVFISHVFFTYFDTNF